MTTPTVINASESHRIGASSVTDPGVDQAGCALPDAPAGAVAVFGEHLPLAVRYAEMLAGPGVERGLLGPREAPRLWERHLLNCAGLTELLEPGQQVLDAGSGAGLPGIVLAICRNDIDVVLVEPLQRRATFLAEVVDELGLSHVSVVRSRLEDLAGKTLIDTVVARAVAPLDRLAAWTMPLLRTGGRLLALKGEQAESELAAGRAALRRAGAESAAVVTVGRPDRQTQARVVVVVRSATASARPRTERR
ncbi:MAG: rRNA (guanine527-N7)-methyltransferase [Actinomycetota bacterium]|jgi:16S rRNA (guanine527-N7)-methyltransferase|nr:rRNA (guanine527-N7)-methyltransferase [Actinomycetota bacterium]